MIKKIKVTTAEKIIFYFLILLTIITFSIFFVIKNKCLFIKDHNPKEINFDGIKTYIPNNPYGYLNWRYGNNWLKEHRNMPINKRYPHEGLSDPFNTCNHHYKIYPDMYKL